MAKHQSTPTHTVLLLDIILNTGDPAVKRYSKELWTLWIVKQGAYVMVNATGDRPDIEYATCRPTIPMCSVVRFYGLANWRWPPVQVTRAVFRLHVVIWRNGVNSEQELKLVHAFRELLPCPIDYGWGDGSGYIPRAGAKLWNIQKKAFKDRNLNSQSMRVIKLWRQRKTSL